MNKKNTFSITLKELSNQITSSIKENFKTKNSSIINEGVNFDNNSDSFIFDFENDNKTDVIELKKIGYKITAFNHCYYYGYQFSENVNSSTRTSFIKSLKFPNKKISEKDKNLFITNAINKLDSDVSLPSFKLIIYPESMSELNRDMIKYLNKFTSPNIVNMELIKSLPSKIEFDYDRFKLEILDSKLSDKRAKYTEEEKQKILSNIEKMMDEIHNLQYFSIARNVKKNKYKQYFKNYYIFKNEEDKKLYETIINANVLIIDDVATSGTTLSHLLYSLRSINDNNNIIIFSLIGKKLI